MKRNRFVKHEKTNNRGRWMFLIIGFVVAFVQYKCSDNIEALNYIPRISKQEAAESRVAQIGQALKIENVSGKSIEAMGSKLIHLDEQMEKESHLRTLSATISLPKLKSKSVVEYKVEDVEEREEPIEEDNEKTEIQTSVDDEEFTFSEDDMSLLKKIVFAETGASSSAELQEGVTAVILNRLESEEYPDTLNEVIFAENQFSPAKDNKIFFNDWVDNQTCYYREVQESDVPDEMVENINKAIDGANPIGEMTSFYATNSISEELMLREQSGEVIIIENVVFHKDW